MFLYMASSKCLSHCQRKKTPILIKTEILIYPSTDWCSLEKYNSFIVDQKFTIAAYPLKWIFSFILVQCDVKVTAFLNTIPSVQPATSTHRMRDSTAAYYKAETREKLNQNPEELDQLQILMISIDLHLLKSNYKSYKVYYLHLWHHCVQRANIIVLNLAWTLQRLDVAGA